MSADDATAHDDAGARLTLARSAARRSPAAPRQPEPSAAASMARRATRSARCEREASAPSRSAVAAAPAVGTTSWMTPSSNVAGVDLPPSRKGDRARAHARLAQSRCSRAGCRAPPRGTRSARCPPRRSQASELQPAAHAPAVDLRDRRQRGRGRAARGRRPCTVVGERLGRGDPSFVSAPADPRASPAPRMISARARAPSWPAIAAPYPGARSRRSAVRA
jgi:hypothetical protein